MKNQIQKVNLVRTLIYRWRELSYITIYFLSCCIIALIPAPFTENNNGTVTDNATGLIWQKCLAGQSSNCSGSGNNFKWSEAISYCNGLSLGNKSGWRLPNINELTSLLDYSSTAKDIIDIQTFPWRSGKGFGIWSSTTNPRNPDYIFGYDNDNYGMIWIALKNGNLGQSYNCDTCKVICVTN